MKKGLKRALFYKDEPRGNDRASPPYSLSISLPSLPPVKSKL